MMAVRDSILRFREYFLVGVVALLIGRWTADIDLRTLMGPDCDAMYQTIELGLICGRTVGCQMTKEELRAHRELYEQYQKQIVEGTCRAPGDRS